MHPTVTRSFLVGAATNVVAYPCIGKRPTYAVEMENTMLNSGNQNLANDISVVMAEAFSEAAIVAIASCEDMNDPLSLLQKKQMLSSFATLMIDTRNRIQCILDLDGIARECMGNTSKLYDLHSDIFIELDNDNDED
ncbi:MAG: hypothetical protein WCK43_07030 [bacterium]